MVERVDVPVAIRDRLRTVCLGLPETREEAAWVGTRWRVRTRTFAHVLAVVDGWPPAYARACGTDGPVTVVMFRSSGPELAALLAAGPPFFGTRWRSDEVGVVVDERGDTDWDELVELITESYCVVAPAKLTRSVVRPE